MSRYISNMGILLIIVIPLILQRPSFAQEEAWEIRIQATGQEDGSSIYIGMDANAVTNPSSPLPYPPESTAYITLAEGILEDIREIGSDSEVWSIKITVGSTADRDKEGYYPELSWDPNGEMIDLTDRLELLYDPNLPDPNRADTLASDMITIKSYQIQPEEGTYHPPPADMTILNYKIIKLKESIRYRYKFLVPEFFQ